MKDQVAANYWMLVSKLLCCFPMVITDHSKFRMEKEFPLVNIILVAWWCLPLPKVVKNSARQTVRLRVHVTLFDRVDSSQRLAKSQQVVS